MRQYHDALQLILNEGEDCENRTGVDTRAIFGLQMRFNLSEGFPAVTSKKLAWKAVVSELLWFLEGSTNERRLAEIHYGDKAENLISQNTIWTANADAQGVQLGYQNDELVKELGPVYGYQWRNFNGVDQIQQIVDQINTTPDNRRIILNSWNVSSIPDMALPPCHVLAQFRVMNEKLSCQLYPRSADMALGVPFNIASYSLLTHMIANYCELEVGDFIHTIGDAHIYHNHIEGIQEQLRRNSPKLPTLSMPNISSFHPDYIRNLSTSQFKLEDYNPLESITFEMVV